MKTKIKRLYCKFFGHTKSGYITGFRHDGVVITYCSICNIPMIDRGYKASSHIVDVITQEQYKRLGLNK